ncbi:MAG: hypothetical protein QM767_01905 [Anaeromyxobacter sp.]
MTSRVIVESLENRLHLSVAKDAAGFTVVTPQNGSRVIYVIAPGKDTNTGLSSASPIKSISKGISLLRSGTGDQLLFKRGETFSGNFGIWHKNGRSATEPLVIGSYGTGEARSSTPAPVSAWRSAARRRSTTSTSRASS